MRPDRAHRTVLDAFRLFGSRPIILAFVSSPKRPASPFYCFMLIWARAMKTTVEVSDDLYRRAKSEAALRGRKLKDLVEQGLRLVLKTPRHTQRPVSLAALMKAARGAVDSGIADLASNPEHLKGFGRNAPRHR